MTASGLAHKAIAERYELIGEVGQGGMATVYMGRDLVLGREVAVKILHAHLAKDPEHRRRFRGEARTTARLQHPNIVKIFDFADQESKSAEGQSNDSPVYLVMEFVKGSTLQEVVETREFPLCELAAALVEQLAKALEHAHEQHVIHRDLKPENVLIQEDGKVKLTDFGLARILDAESMTRTGTILGSPAYMAPEQLEGKTIDHRSDLFALGVILYRLACQQHPFDLSNPMAILKAVGSGSFRDPEAVRPGIGKQLARIIKRAMALDPERRYANVGEMRSALQEYLEEAGIEDPAATVREYLLAEDAVVPKIQSQIILFLKASARRLARQKRFAAALDRCNRVLSLDPNDSDTHGLIRRLSQQERWGQWSLWVGAAAMIVGLLIGGWFFTQTIKDPGNKPTVGITTRIKLTPSVRKEPLRPPVRERKRITPPKRRVILPSRTLCRIPVPRGRGRYFDLQDFNLGFRLALRGSKRRRVLAIRLKRRRRSRGGLLRYRGSVYASVDRSVRHRLSMRRTTRIRMRRGDEHTLAFYFSALKIERKCQLFIPLERRPRRKPPKRKGDPDVQPKAPEPGPPRLFTVRILGTNTAIMQVNDTFSAKTYLPMRFIGRKKRLKLFSGWTWKLTLTHRFGKTSRWLVAIPKDARKPIRYREVSAKGNSIRSGYLRYSPILKMPVLDVALQPRRARIRIGCAAPEALLVLGRGAQSQRENFTGKLDDFYIQKTWAEWAVIMQRGIKLRVVAPRHSVWHSTLRIAPGQTKFKGMIKLPRAKLSKRHVKRRKPPKRR